MISLTPRQQDLLHFIAGYQTAHGFSPTLDEMIAGIGLVARSGAHRLLEGLAERGAISRVTQRSRSVEILVPITVPKASDGAPLYYVKLQEIAA